MTGTDCSVRQQTVTAGEARGGSMLTQTLRADDGCCRAPV